MKECNIKKFNKIKNLIAKDTLEATETIYLTEESLEEIFPILVESSESIDNFTLFENACEVDILFQFLAKHKNNSRKVTRCIAVRYVRQANDSDLINIIRNDNASGIETSLCVLTRIELENMDYPFDFVLFDKELALVLKNEIGTGYYLTNNQEVINRCLSWLKVDRISEKSIDKEFLQEPLMKSADMINEVSSLLCTKDHMNLEGCHWYHSVWQYLRLLDLVSTPSWHHEFYINQINAIAKQQEFMEVLISGAADYSTLSYVMHVLEKFEYPVTYSVLDLCETPLFACRWYGKRHGKDVQTIQKSIFELNCYGNYNLIVTDAFLTRFSKGDIDKILKIWNSSLKANGHIVTTVRIHDENHICPDVPLSEAVDAFVDKAYKRAKIWGKYINLSPEEIATKARNYATKMKSNCLGTKEEILEAFHLNGFHIIYLDDAEVKGELYPSRYLRIVAKKV